MTRRLLSPVVGTFVGTAGLVLCLQVSIACMTSAQATKAPGKAPTKGVTQAAPPCEAEEALVRDTGAPLEPSTVTQEPYTIGQTDRLTISVTPDEPVGDSRRCSGEYPVGIDGKISFCQPLGSIAVEFLTESALEEKLRKLFVDAKIWNDPQVTVVVKEYRSQSVFVNGAVRTPGELNLKGEQMTLLNAVQSAGGFSAEAGPLVWILRPRGPVTVATSMTLDDPSAEKRKYLRKSFDLGLEDPRLRNGDSVFVEKAELFFVNGEVKSGGQKTWECGMNVGKALAMSSGQTDKASLGRSYIRRFDTATQKYVQIKNLKLETPILPRDELTMNKKLF